MKLALFAIIIKLCLLLPQLASASLLGFVFSNSTFTSIYILYHLSSLPGTDNNVGTCPYQPYDFYHNTLKCLPEPTFSNTAIIPTSRGRNYEHYKVVGRLVLRGGERYVGNIWHGKRHGIGHTTWPNGASYVGGYKNNIRHGIGRTTWPDKTIYYGQFENNLPHGMGNYSYPNGNSYYGQVVNDTLYGQGTKLFSDGGEYTGEFANNTFHGVGNLSWPNGQWFYGQFSNGFRHGEVTVSWPSGFSLNVTFTNGEGPGWFSAYFFYGSLNSYLTHQSPFHSVLRPLVFYVMLGCFFLFVEESVRWFYRNDLVFNLEPGLVAVVDSEDEE